MFGCADLLTNRVSWLGGRVQEQVSWEQGRRQEQLAAFCFGENPEAQPKNIDRPRVKRAFHRPAGVKAGQDCSIAPGQGTAPGPKTVLSAVTTPATYSD